MWTEPAQPEQPCTPVTHTTASPPQGSAAPRPGGKNDAWCFYLHNSPALCQGPPPHGRAPTHTYVLVNHGKKKTCRLAPLTQRWAHSCVMQSRSVRFLPCKAGRKMTWNGITNIYKPTEAICTSLQMDCCNCPKDLLQLVFTCIHLISGLYLIIHKNLLHTFKVWLFICEDLNKSFYLNKAVLCKAAQTGLIVCTHCFVYVHVHVWMCLQVNVWVCVSMCAAEGLCVLVFR